jgi:hypothetical protein
MVTTVLQSISLWIISNFLIRLKGNVTYDNGIYIEGSFLVEFNVVSSSKVSDNCVAYQNQYLCSGFDVSLYVGMNLSLGLQGTQLSAQVFLLSYK